MRAELVPGCQLLSHLTILPPRDLTACPEELVRELERREDQLHSFEVSLENVEAFESTGVIYLSVGKGRAEIEEIHKRLSGGIFSFQEPFPFHPHVTLAQENPHSERQPRLAQALASWKAWPHTRTFLVDRLTFVRNITPTRWDTLSEHQLLSPRLRRTA